MNIFVTSPCPVESAAYLDDKRCIKMCLESTQILCTVLNQKEIKTPYRSSHAKHPCTVWASESRQNWMWLWIHGMALCYEYTNRYGKVHKCENILLDLFKYVECLDDKELTPFINCAANNTLGVDYKNVEDVHEAYKLYLSHRWELDRRRPTWYKQER